MKKRFLFAAVTLALVALLMVPSIALAGRPGRPGRPRNLALTGGLVGTWTGTYQSQAPGSPPVSITWKIKSLNGNSFTADVTLTKDAGQPSEFSILLPNNVGTVNGASISLTTTLKMHVKDLSSSPADITLVTENNNGVLNNAVSPTQMTFNGTVQQKLTYPPLFNNTVQDTGSLTLYRQQIYPYWPYLSVLKLFGGHSYLQWLLSYYSGNVQSAVNTNGKYSIGFNIWNSSPASFDMGSASMTQACSCADHPKMTASFPKVAATRTGNNVEATLPIVFVTTMGTTTININLHGVMNANKITGTYDISVTMLSLPAVPIDNGNLDIKKKFSLYIPQ